jgi:hypothetical protein
MAAIVNAAIKKADRRVTELKKEKISIPLDRFGTPPKCRARTAAPEVRLARITANLTPLVLGRLLNSNTGEAAASGGFLRRCRQSIARQKQTDQMNACRKEESGLNHGRG